MKSKKLQRSETLYKPKWFGVIVLFILVGCNCFVVASSKEKSEHKNEKIYKADIPSDKEQEISIVIGSREGDSGQIGINNDDEGGESGNATVTASESISYDNCRQPNARCCYQYTWPGFEEKIPEAENATCEFLKKKKADNTIACFDPMVYTVSRTGELQGNPPNFTELRKDAEDNNRNIYCIMSGGRACVTYSFYSLDRKMVNQTKFCGVVTNNDNGREEKGCYSQKIDGHLREVCVCKDRLCNKAPSLVELPSRLKLTWITFVIMAYASKLSFFQ